MAEAEYKIDRIEKVGSKDAVTGPTRAANKDYFEALMNQQRTQVDPTTVQKTPEDETKFPTLMDEVSKLNARVDHVAEASPHQLVGQADDIIAQIDKVKETLNSSPDADLNKTAQRILRNKLSHVDENLKVALSRVGVEYTPPPLPTNFETPIDRFLGLLTHGQSQLQGMSKELNHYALNKEEMNPASLLLVQIKMNYVQQEIELFTSMLNKALESTKTIMNVQV